jgi:hypothetical protein
VYIVDGREEREGSKIGRVITIYCGARARDGKCVSTQAPLCIPVPQDVHGARVWTHLLLALLRVLRRTRGVAHRRHGGPARATRLVIAAHKGRGEREKGNATKTKGECDEGRKEGRKEGEGSRAGIGSDTGRTRIGSMRARHRGRLQCKYRVRRGKGRLVPEKKKKKRRRSEGAMKGRANRNPARRAIEKERERATPKEKKERRELTSRRRRPRQTRRQTRPSRTRPRAART